MQEDAAVEPGRPLPVLSGSPGLDYAQSPYQESPYQDSLIQTFRQILYGHDSP